MAEITQAVSQRAKSSLTTLSNATELVSTIVMGVVGNDVSDSLKGNRISGGIIKTMIQTHLVENLNKPKK